MNFKYLVFFLLFGTSCGVKGPPLAPPGTETPAFSAKYTSLPELLQRKKELDQSWDQITQLGQENEQNIYSYHLTLAQMKKISQDMGLLKAKLKKGQGLGLRNLESSKLQMTLIEKETQKVKLEKEGHKLCTKIIQTHLTLKKKKIPLIYKLRDYQREKNLRKEKGIPTIIPQQRPSLELTLSEIEGFYHNKDRGEVFNSVKHCAQKTES